ncbi:hypothetical protein BKA64DRAFT_399128 [Cadophora sp. MPI-SDFR-AT-0126]|nr:hypothetical protein BKA64DRAFT_399128 [Leotiomycetes sp. MPI-SDFR-AT-0126]
MSAEMEIDGVHLKNKVGSSVTSSSRSKRSGPLAPGVAFITGGARGLGNAIAVSFAKDGARGVVIVDINQETLNEGRKIVESYGTKCLDIQADVTKEKDIERAVAEAVKEFGRIDYAANFAGILGPMDQTSDLPLEGFQKVMSVNCTGVYLSTKHELRQMMKQDSLEVEEGRVEQRGSIVNCASINSGMALPGTLPYTTAKHAVLGITRTAALEARSQGIRVNAVSPGFFLTDLLKPVVGTVVPMAFYDACETRQGRAAKFEEVGDVVVLLSGPRMSLVNGANLPIDGGFTINEA